MKKIILKILTPVSWSNGSGPSSRSRKEAVRGVLALPNIKKTSITEIIHLSLHTGGID